VEVAEKLSESLRFDRAEDLTLRLHSLIRRGEGEGEAADEVRKALHEEWAGLSPGAQRNLQRLSAELASTYSPEVARHESARTPAAVRLNRSRRDNVARSERVARAARRRKRIWKDARKAWFSKKWNDALELMRMAPDAWPAYALAFFRSRAYLSLGRPKPAILFLQRAVDIGPKDFRVLLINTLAEVGETDEAVRLAKVAIADSAATPFEVFTALGVLQRAAEQVAPDERRKQLIDFAELADKALKTAHSAPVQHQILGYLLLGSLYDQLNEPLRAAEILSSGMSIAADDPSLWIARGLVREKQNLPLAIEDFVEAVEKGARFEYPYLVTAGAYGELGQFDHVIEITTKGLRVATNSRVIAKLLQYRAMAAYEIGISREVVEADFEAARRLAPEDEQISENYERYRQVRDQQTSNKLLKWTKSQVDATAAGRVKGDLLSRSADPFWEAADQLAFATA
jgi:tetratricopeptide (TPR) repeat protein